MNKETIAKHMEELVAFRIALDDELNALKAERRHMEAVENLAPMITEMVDIRINYVAEELENARYEVACFVEQCKLNAYTMESLRDKITDAEVVRITAENEGRLVDDVLKDLQSQRNAIELIGTRKATEKEIEHAKGGAHD